MKPIDVSADNFEALLAYDDLFLDYFNAFLQLPAFPQPLYYNRLTGTFQETEDDGPQTSSALASIEEGIPGSPRLLNPVYAPGDEERERIVDWAKTQRLPLFLRTKLFLEYKLCKLLIRPSDDRRSTSRPNSSRGLRGYSRETTSYTTTSASLAQSCEPSIYDNEGSDYVYWLDESERMAMFRYLRPGSRCISLPPMLGLAPNSPVWSVVRSDVPNAMTNVNGNPLPKEHGRVQALDSEWTGTTPQLTQAVGQLRINEDADSSPKQEAGPASRKSALRSPGSKRLSPKKKTTILMPNADTTLSLTQEEASHMFQLLDGLPSSSGSFQAVGASSYQTSLEQSLLAGDDDEDDNDDGDDEDDDEDDDVAEDEDDDRATGTASVIEYDDEEEERTESELRQIEGRHRVTFQQLKEQLIASLQGMAAFKSFLQDTAGIGMMNFWLDCESYSDSVQYMDANGAFTSTKMTKLFRDIQDKYKFNLTSDAKEQIKQAQGNTGLSQSVFTRTQYDILRRLRSYWVARFVLHNEGKGHLRSVFRDTQFLNVSDVGGSPPRSPKLSFLPSISLVNSLPVRPSSCIRLASTSRDWSKVAMGGRRVEESVRPGDQVDPFAVPYIPRPVSARFHAGLACDRQAGRPFQRHLEGQPDKKLLALLLFLQEVTDYGAEEDRAADRLLRMGHAWQIFSKFIMDGGLRNIGIDPFERDNIHRCLLAASDFVEASTFSSAKDYAVLMLQREWLVYLKDDLREFLRCRARPEDTASSKSSATAVQAPLNRQVQFNVTRASTPAKTPRCRKMGKAHCQGHDLSPIVRKKAKEKKRKEQLAMQRKLLRQVKKARAEAKKKNLGVKFQTPEEEQEGRDDSKGTGRSGRGGRKESDQHGSAVPQVATYQPPNVKPADETREDATFKKMTKNKQLIALFKNYMQEIEGKENLSSFNMYFDIEAALRLSDAHAEKRYTLSRQICSAYFDPASKKAVELSDDILTRLSSEGDRPTVKTLEAAQKHVLPKLEQVFSNFWIAHVDTADDHCGGGGGDAKFDQAVRSGSTHSLVLAWKRRRRGKGSHSGHQMPTSQDKNEFTSFLLKSARGIPPEKMMYFHSYLMEYGEKDTMPLLEKDLVFYLEAQRFKESHHAYSDIIMLKRKVEVIIDCFLDSTVASPAVQIDVPSEMSSKLLKQADNYLKDKGKDPHNASMFDDAQYTVFKEMLPYWSSFSTRYREYHDRNPRLHSTKIQKLTKQRLKKFLDMKDPRRDFKLPSLSTASQNRTGGSGITFSISEGIQWKSFDLSDASDGVESPNQSRRPSSIDSTIFPPTHRLRAGTNHGNLLSQESTSTRSSRGAPRVYVTAS